MRPFVNGARYRHLSCLDLDIWVIKVQYGDKKRTHLKFHWIYQRTDLLFITEKGTVLAKDYDKWRRVYSPIAF